MDMLAAAALMDYQHREVAQVVAGAVEHLLVHLRQIVERVD